MSSSISFSSHARIALIALCLLWPLATTGSAEQAGVTVSGQLQHSVSLQPVPNATVILDELQRGGTSDADGQFAIDDVPPGTYHLMVYAAGYVTTRVEVTVGSSAVIQDIPVDPELHYSEVVSVSPEARGQEEAYQPTSVLAGQDLSKRLESSLGATLDSEPGVSQRSLGPAPSRPVIRGLDGDRVLILEDGQRTGDLSSQSADHGVTVNPAAARRIEVVRGPATLLYGSNAIGGLVNVISDVVPTQPVNGTSGRLTADLTTGAKGGGTATDITWGNGRLAIHAGGAGRRTGDVSTPSDTLPNSQSRSGLGSVAMAWTGQNGYVGAHYGYDDMKYGIPFVEEGMTQLTPRRHQVGIRGERRNLEGLFEGFEGSLEYHHYRHDELDGEVVATAFKNDTTEVEVQGHQRAAGRWTGTLGAWGLNRDFSAEGEEALSPPVRQTGVAAFAYEELTWPHATVQFGGRFDHARYRPSGGLPTRTFNEFSGSLGLLVRPAAEREGLTLALSLARAARYPALEELYFFGNHAGNFSFEIGNPAINPEHAIGLDASLRWRAPRVSGEVTYFRNSINDFIFRRPLSAAEFETRFGEEAEFIPIEFTAADSVLQGVEVHADVELSSVLIGELGLDMVRGRLTETDDPLPRMPPLRFRGGLRFQRNAFQVGGEVVAVAPQDRVYQDVETPTDGYGLLKLFTAYSFTQGDVVHTITVRADNVTNELYRNHLSYLKDLVPEMGRDVRVIYGITF